MITRLRHRLTGHDAEQREAGTILLLTIGLVTVCLLLVVVVVDASAVFLQRRSLASLSDGAALAAVQSANEPSAYSGDGIVAGDAVLLNQQQAQDAAAAYLATAGEQGVSLAGVTVDGTTVTVSVSKVSSLPFLGGVGVAQPTITASATASNRTNP